MNKKKMLSICLATTMAVNALPMTVFASSIGSSADNTNIGEDTAQNAKTHYTEIAESNAQTQVYLTVSDSDLIVSLPTTVIVSGTPDNQGKYVGNYSIGVKGDMAGDKTVNIEPENTNVELKQKGKENKTAAVEQSQTKFTADDFKNNTNTTGTITAEGLTAGSWNGAFNFNVQSGTQTIPNGYRLLYKLDLSATENDNVAAYYCVPNENTEEIELSAKSKAISAYANEDNVIIKDGIKYILSDKDKLIISGQGNMVSDVPSYITDFEKLLNMVSQNASLMDFINYYNYSDTKGFRLSDKDDKSAITGTLTNTEISKRSIKYSFTYYDHNVSRFEECSLEIGFVAGHPDYMKLKSPAGTISKGSTLTEYSYSYSNYLKSTRTADWWADYINNNKGTYYLSDVAEAYFDYLCNYHTSIENEVAITVPREVVFEEGVTEISKDCFLKELRLKKVTISKTVKTIGEGAFSGCTGLEELNIANGIQTIGESAFLGCTGLEELNVPNTVIEIGKSAFSNCNFKNITIPSSVKTIGDNAFYSHGRIDTLKIEEGVETIGEKAFYNESSGSVGDVTIENCYIPKSVTKYGRNAFSIDIHNLYYNGTLDDYVKIKQIPKIVRGKEVYKYDTPTFPMSCVVPKSTYYNTNPSVYFNGTKIDLENFVVPATITEIPNGIFAFAPIQNIKLAGNVTKIGEYAFYYCRHCQEPNYVSEDIHNIYLPTTITEIGNKAFDMVYRTSNFYCQSQNVADLLVKGTNCMDNNDTNIIVDATKF